MDEYVYPKVERRNPKEHRHKLAPVVEGPYKVRKFDNNIAVIEKTDR